MQLPLFSLGMLLALTLIVTGCGDGKNTETLVAEGNAPGATIQTNSPAPSNVEVTSTGTTSHPSQEVVKKFLMELMKNNTQGAVALITPKAQQEYAKQTFSLNSMDFTGVEFRITGSDLVFENDPNFFGVRADMVMSGNIDEATPTVWLVRKINNNEYRVAGMMFFDNEIEDYVTWDFERQITPDGTPSAQQRASANQMPANNQQMVPQNPQSVQQIAQPPQFEPFQFNAPVQQQPNMNPSQMALPNMPNIH
jgi:hypothetical protein